MVIIHLLCNVRATYMVGGKGVVRGCFTQLVEREMMFKWIDHLKVPRDITERAAVVGKGDCRIRGAIES